MWSLPALPDLSVPISDNGLLLVNVLIQITVLAALAIVAGRFFKKQATIRYTILFPAMLCLIVVVVASTAFHVFQRNLLSIELDSEFIAPETSFLFDVSPSDFEFNDVNDQAVGLVPSLSGEPIPEQSTTLDSLRDLPPTLIAFVLWVGGFFIFAIGILRSLHQVEKLAKHSITPPAEELTRLKAISSQLKISPQTIFRLSDKINSPVIAGIVNPVILIPRGFTDRLSDGQLREVLTHEFAHIARRDALSNFIQKTILAIFWFHPLIHYLDREISQAREEVCDNYVLQQESALQYGETLFAVNSLRRSFPNNRAPVHQLGILSKQWNLEDRIRELLDTSRSQSVTISSQLRTLLLISLSAVTLGLAGCQIQAAENQTPEQRISDLENQTRALQQERNNLAQQAEALREQLNRITEQEQRLEEQEQGVEEQSQEMLRQAQLMREQMSRSLTEIRSILQSAETEAQLEDIQELTERLLRDMLEKVENTESAVISPETQNALNDLADEVANNTADKPQILRDVGSIQARLFAGNRPIRPQGPRRARPTAPLNATNELREPTMLALNEVQELLSPQDLSVEPRYSAAKERLDQHYNSNWESMNSFEKTMLLNFYTSYWLGIGDYQGAVATFEQILQLEGVREDILLRTYRSLGQLYAALDRWEPSITNYTAWRERSGAEDSVVFKGLSYAHYQLEQYDEALPYWQQYMSLASESNDTLGRDDYAYLNGIFFTLEMFEEALENTKEMIVLFNHPTDWRNLRAIHDRLGMLEPDSENDQEENSDV
ncbi:MAG: M48 family metalloprotease [Pseudomonadales bacterium]|nr:M48 family metalloprotease [Pseudomonadales bacterium]